MKFLLIPCLLIFACAVAGCRRTGAPPPTAPPLTSPTPQLAHAEGGNTPAPETKYFKGSIGSSLDLQMKLVRSADQLSGSYFYQRIGTRINLRGKIEPDGQFLLDEFDQSGKQTGTFKGRWMVDTQDGLASLAGFWTKPNQKESDKVTAFSVHEEPIALTGDVEIVAKQIKESNKKLMYEVAARYPQLSGGSNPNFEKFNQLVRGSVTRKVAEFKKDTAPGEGEEPRPEGSMGSDLGIAYEIALAQDDLISVQFDIGSYYQGAAHPNSYTEVINYDLKNGKELKLSDLFKPGAKYLQAIATYCIADLKKQQASDKGKALTDSEIASGAAAKAENYKSWKITRKGLGINFDAYQVGPYAAGPQEVLVPYANLKDLINPEGPIAQFAK
ncbi:MAG TPA: RsiV family protein [Pyrinomonadaceae bacterium]|nr:RsiV family protein [Pyrinomonadaceae bacterium]